MPRHAATPVPAGHLPLLAPMLATPAPSLPRDQDTWTGEIKWDGMRVLAYLDGAAGLRLLTRGGNDVADRYPELAVLPDLLPGVDAILDGEIIAADPGGRPDFARL